MTTATPATKKYTGGCHCGQVRFEVELDLSGGGGMCNCTVCTKISPISAITKPEAFRQLAGEDSLSTYEWGGRISRRKFCKHCGVHCFAFGHLAELGGDYVGINLNCIDDFDRGTIAISYWDGRHNNWEGGMRSTPWPVLP
jgi:hypothetical protein